MSKAPNIDYVRTRTHNCWYCENYARTARKCECKQSSRAAEKRRALQDIEQQVSE